MKKTIIFVICIIIVIVTVTAIAIVLNKDRNLEISENTKQIEKRLLNYGEYRVGKVEDIINIKYDKVYSIIGEKSKKEIETHIGIKNSKLKPSHSNEMSIIFIKDNKITAYLQGNKNEKGYYLDLAEGEYLEEELKLKNYIAKSDDKCIYYEIEK